MWKSCSKCHRIHPANYRCTAGQIRRAKRPDQQLRSTSRWTKKSQEIREASKWLCAICLEEGRFNYEELEVHHITKLKDDPEGLLDNQNLICLCKRHHELADAGKIDPEHLRELARDRESSQ